MERMRSCLIQVYSKRCKNHFPWRKKKIDQLYQTLNIFLCMWKILAKIKKMRNLLLPVYPDIALVGCQEAGGVVQLSALPAQLQWCHNTDCLSQIPHL